MAKIMFEHKGCDGWAIYDSKYIDAKDARNMHVVEGNVINVAEGVRFRPGIILVARLLVSRAGGIKSPQSPTYQQAETKMKSEREKILCFLLLLFLSRRAGRVEIRHGTVVAFDLRARPCCRPLAHGHWIRLGATASPSRRVHHSLICRSAKLAVKRTGNDLATRVGAPRVHQRGADSPMPERMVI